MNCGNCVVCGRMWGNVCSYLIILCVRVPRMNKMKRVCPTYSLGSSFDSRDPDQNKEKYFTPKFLLNISECMLESCNGRVKCGETPCLRILLMDCNGFSGEGETNLRDAVSYQKKRPHCAAFIAGCRPSLRSAHRPWTRPGTTYKVPLPNCSPCQFDFV